MVISYLDWRASPKMAAIDVENDYHWASLVTHDGNRSPIGFAGHLALEKSRRKSCERPRVAAGTNTSSTDHKEQSATFPDGTSQAESTDGDQNGLSKQNDRISPREKKRIQAKSNGPSHSVETQTDDVANLMAGRSIERATQNFEVANSGWFSLKRLCAALWLAGCGFVFTRIFAGWYFLRCIMQDSQMVPDSLMRLARRTAESMKLPACPRVVSTARINTPCLSGIVDPVIFLPTTIVEQLDEADMVSVIAHECAHLERNDLFWNAVWQGLSALLWFHPLVWRARLAHVDSCDSVVDARVSDHFNNRVQYCRTLALLALRANSMVPVTSLGMARHSTVRKRIDQLKSGVPACRLSTQQTAAFVGVTMLVVVLLGSLGISRVAASATERDFLSARLATSDSKDARQVGEPALLSSPQLLPAYTQAWISIPDGTRLNKRFFETQIGELTQNKAMAPFVRSLRGQLQDWMNDKNIWLGLDNEKIQNVRSGEISMAGIMPQQLPLGAKLNALNSHGMVLLVDVSENLEQAHELLSKGLVARGATKEKIPGSIGTQIYKWKIPNQLPGKKPRIAFHTIADGWLLSSDNEAIFQTILRKMVNKDGVREEQTVASHPAFQSVMKNIELRGFEPQAFWYVNPFGCIQLARAIVAERRRPLQKNNEDWGRLLNKIGFDGFKGVGGYLAFATGEHELLHRTFVFKPVGTVQDIKERHVFGLFDFKNTSRSLLTPPAFISDKTSSYFCVAWDMQQALDSFGHVIDTFTRQEGVFNDALIDLRQEMQIDVPRVIAKFDKEIMVFTNSQMPLENESEQIVIAIRLRGDPEYVIDNIKKSWPHQHKLMKFQGSTIVAIEDAGGDDKFEVKWENEPVHDPFDSPVDEFASRYCVTNDGYLLVSNNMDYLKNVLQSNHEMPVSASGDYLRIAASLDSITDSTRIGFRQYSRLDRAVRSNYEMIRFAKAASTNTILSQLVGFLFKFNQDNPKRQERVPKIDGSTLPPNYQRHIAPYLGPSGCVMEITDDGWRFTGVILPAK